MENLTFLKFQFKYNNDELRDLYSLISSTLTSRLRGFSKTLQDRRLTTWLPTNTSIPFQISQTRVARAFTISLTLTLGTFLKKNYKTGLTARRPFSGLLPRDLLPSYCRISGLTADLLPIGALLRYSVVGCPSRFSISRTEAVVLRVNQDAFNAGPKATVTHRHAHHPSLIAHHPSSNNISGVILYKFILFKTAPVFPIWQYNIGMIYFQTIPAVT